MATVAIDYASVLQSRAQALQAGRGLEDWMHWLPFQGLLGQAGLPAFESVSGVNDTATWIGPFADWLRAQLAPYTNSDGGSAPPYDDETYLTQWIAGQGYDIGVAWLPTNEVEYRVFYKGSPTPFYIRVSLSDPAFGAATLAFAAFAAYVVYADIALEAAAEAGSAGGGGAVETAVDTSSSLAPGEEVVGSGAAETTTGVTVDTTSGEVVSSLPEYTYTPPTFEAPIPEVAIAPTAVPSSSVLADIGAATKTISAAMGTALSLVSAFKKAGQPAPRTTSAPSAGSPVGQPMVLPDGSLYVNNGDGTYTLISADGSTSTHRFAGAAGALQPWMIVAGAAVVGALVLASRRSR